MTSPLVAAGVAANQQPGEFGQAVQPCPLKASWVELEVAAGEGVRYRLTDALDRAHEGTLDASGIVRVAVPVGSCKISFPDLDQELDGERIAGGVEVYRGPVTLLAEKRHQISLPDWALQTLQAEAPPPPARAPAREPDAPAAAAAAAEENDDWALDSMTVET